MPKLQMILSHLRWAVPLPSLIRLPILIAAAVLNGPPNGFCLEPETIGLDAMRRERPGITGIGIPVAQPEGLVGPDAWEVDPVVNSFTFFTWTAASGTATNYPNSVGVVSSHATSVGVTFYGSPSGVAPGVARVDSYDAGYFIDDVIIPKQPIKGQVINQSFITDNPVDLFYDAYAATYNVLFVSGMNNAADTPHSPGTAYNGMGVGNLTASGLSSVGPTTDGRAKPDIVAPDACCTSLSTPQVAGAAALLLQAGAANDAGAGTASLATNVSVVKALLLNGAVKTTNWTNGVTRPLDARYGAGALNIYNSDVQLRGGRRAAAATNNVTVGAAHPPTNDTNSLSSLRGWDFSRIASTLLNDRVAHYYFTLPTNAAAYSATATLVWKKGTGTLTNLDLFLYETRSNTLVTSSTSSVDNVEHIFVPLLPAGRYDLQVLKRGATPGDESYALAFDFSPLQLMIARKGSNAVVAWPASPAGFTLQAAQSLDLPIAWQAITNRSMLSNTMNTITLQVSSAQQFFRLFRP